MGNRSWKMGLDKMFSDTHKHNSAGAHLNNKCWMQKLLNIPEQTI